GELNALQRSGEDEIHRAALAANALMDCCAAAVAAVLRQAGIGRSQIAAIGVHGQTVRHRPDLEYTTQLANSARLAEATGLPALQADAYFARPPPKSTGRDHFNLPWLERHLAPLRPSPEAADVQRTLLALTARTIGEAVAAHCGNATEVLLCGGGAHNIALRSELEAT